MLITGGYSGIGAGLAKAFHGLGYPVIAAGRNNDALADFSRQNPGMDTAVVDVSNAESVQACAEDVTRRFGNLHTVISNAGIQRPLRFDEGRSLPVGELTAEVDVNLKGVLYVANAFLPHLLAQPSARLVNVSSALAFVPIARVPVYCATKAAVHSFTQSLRFQLRETNVKVVELIPPLVESNLHRSMSSTPPGAMPLNRFIQEAMAGLDSGKDEIAVSRASLLGYMSRIAPRIIFQKINESVER